MFYTKKSSYPIGLDISDLSLKLVQLNKVRDKIKIQAIGKTNLEPGIITNGIVKNKPELIKALRKIISEPLYGRVSSEEIVACLPESKNFIKLIEIQKSPNALADVIGAEIEKHIPLSLSDIYYDWQVINESNDSYSVLIGAAPRNIVDQYASLIDEAKLWLVALEIEPVAIARCLLKEEALNSKPTIFGLKNKTEKGMNYGLIDIGAAHTCMIFYAGNTILFTFSMPISGEEITAKISKALSLTKAQAEKAKIICGLDENQADGVIKDIIAEMIKSLVSKIKEAISYYENYFSQYGPLDQILLSGGGANIVNLVKIIGQEIPIETKLADALINLNESKDKFEECFTEKHRLDVKTAKLNLKNKVKNLTVKQNAASTYTTAIGLALRKIFTDQI